MYWFGKVVSYTDKTNSLRGNWKIKNVILTKNVGNGHSDDLQNCYFTKTVPLRDQYKYVFVSDLTSSI